MDFESAWICGLDPSTTPPNDLFIAYTDAIVRMAMESGSAVIGYKDKALLHFSLLSDSRKTDVLSALEALLTSGLDCRDISPDSELLKPMFAAYLKRRDFTVPANFFDLVENGETFDVYSLSHVFVYGSLNFLKLPSYTVEQLYCLPWPDLYARDTPGVDEDFRALGLEMAEGKHRTVVDTSYIKNHVAFEIHSTRRRCAASIPRYCSPMFHGGKPVGYVWVTKYGLIGDLVDQE